MANYTTKYRIPDTTSRGTVDFNFSPLKYAPYAQACICKVTSTVNDKISYALFSYSTCVAYVSYTGKMVCFGTYSSQTRWHIGKFAKEISDIFDLDIPLTYQNFRDSLGRVYDINTGEMHEGTSMTFKDIARSILTQHYYAGSGKPYEYIPRKKNK